MKHIEAMKLALEALENFKNDEIDAVESFEQCETAITALREALAGQPAQRKPLPDGIPSPDELEALSDGNSGMIFNTGFPTKLDNLACWLREYAAIEAAHNIKENT